MTRYLYIFVLIFNLFSSAHSMDIVSQKGNVVEGLKGLLRSEEASWQDKLAFLEQEENSGFNASIFAGMTRASLNQWVEGTKKICLLNIQTSNFYLNKVNNIETNQDLQLFFKEYLFERFNYLIERKYEWANLSEMNKFNPKAIVNPPISTAEADRKNMGPLSLYISQTSIDQFDQINLALRIMYDHIKYDLDLSIKGYLEGAPILYSYLNGEINSHPVQDMCMGDIGSYEREFFGTLVFPDPATGAKLYKVVPKSKFNEIVANGGATRVTNSDVFKPALKSPESKTNNTKQTPQAAKKKRTPAREQKLLRKKELEELRLRTQQLAEEHKREELLKQQRKEEQKQAQEAFRLRWVEARKKQAQERTDAVFDSISPNPTSSTTEAEEKPREKVKTTGVANLDLAQDYKKVKNITSQETANLRIENSLRIIYLHNQMYTLFETFWTIPAGFSYDNFEHLFTYLGGRVFEKKGGSSHVRLEYDKEGRVIVGGTWRPHPIPTFGYHGLRDLRLYFDECDLIPERVQLID